VHRTDDGLGSYSFGYDEAHTTGGSFHKESGSPGVKVGSYGLHGADGRVRVVNYVADGLGFRADIKTNEPGVGAQAPAATAINGVAGDIATPIATYGHAIAAPAIATYGHVGHVAHAIAAPAVATYGHVGHVGHAIATPAVAAYNHIGHVGHVGHIAPVVSGSYTTAVNHGVVAAPAVAYAAHHVAPAVINHGIGYAGNIHHGLGYASTIHGGLGYSGFGYHAGFPGHFNKVHHGIVY